MSIEKADAIVLRVVDFSESSCVLTLFSKEFGKIRALAKGGRRPKGPFEAALDLLAHCRILFLRKSSDALDLLTEAKLLKRYRPANGDLANLYAAYYVAELLNELTDDYDPHPNLFDFANQTLVQLAAGDPIDALVLRFELNALQDLGHMPLLDQCVECGKKYKQVKRVSFGLIDGGILCSRCKVSRSQVVTISSQVLDTLTEFTASAKTGSELPTIDPTVRGELRSVVNRYFTHHVGHPLKMHKFLGIGTI